MSNQGQIVKLSDYSNHPQDTVFNQNVIMKENNSGGGNMDNNYVTHKELQLHTEVINANTNAKFAEVDVKFAKMDTEFAKVNGKIDTLSSKIDSLTKVVWWIMAIIASGITIPILTFLIKVIFA